MHQWLVKYFKYDFNVQKNDEENKLLHSLLRFAQDRLKKVPEDEEGRDIEVKMRQKFLSFVTEKMEEIDKEEITEENSKFSFFFELNIWSNRYQQTVIVTYSIKNFCQKLKHAF